MSANGKKHQQPPQVGTERLEVCYDVDTEGIDEEVKELPVDFEGFENGSVLLNTNEPLPRERHPYFVT